MAVINSEEYNMKKTILVGIIAVAMLFAFTACEQQMQWPTNLEALNVTYGGTAEGFYLVGETYNPADITVNVEYTDGSSRSYTGDQVGLTATALSSVMNDTTVSYGGKNDWQISIPAVTVASASYVIDVTGAEATIIAKGGNLDTTGVAVSATYNGSTKEVTTDSIFNSVVANLSADTTGAVDTTTTVELAANAPANVSLEGTWTLTVKETGYVASTDLVSVKVEQAEDNEVFIVGDTNTLDDVEYVVTGTYADGHSAVISGAEITYDKYADTYEFTSLTPMTFDVTYTVGTGATAKNYPATLTVTPVADYPIVIAAAWRDTNSTEQGVQAPTYTPSNTVPVSDIVFTVANAGTNWASGNSYTDETNPGVNTSNIKINNALIKTGFTGASQTITFEYTVETEQAVTFNPTSLNATVTQPTQG